MERWKLPEITNYKEPIFLRNLTIYPIAGKNKNGFEAINIEEALKKKIADISELDEPQIDNLEIENQGRTPLLMLDGEEVIGSLQNRIIACSTLIPERTRERVAVFCAEEGRWNEIGGFKTGFCSYPKIRAILSQKSHKRTDLQHRVWNEIKRKLTTTRVSSATSSMHEIYTTLNNEIERYIEDFKGLDDNIIGFIGCAKNHILSCDIFLNPKIYKRFEPKLLRAYALDAIEYQHIKSNNSDINEFFKGLCYFFEHFNPRKDVKHFRIRQKTFFGQAVAHKNSLIHLSIFPN